MDTERIKKSWGCLYVNSLSRKLGVIGLSAAAMAMIVTGCGSTSSNSSSNSGGGAGASNSSNTASGGSSQKTVTLSVMGWNIAEETIQKDAALYQKEHPNVHFKWIKEDSPPNDYTKLNAELAAGSGVPDVMIVESDMAGSFVSKFPNAFLDVTNDVQDLQSKFVQSKWPPLTYKGKIYGIPWDTGPSMVFYRRDLFQQAGIDPSKIVTWSDYIAAGQKLVQHFNGKVKMTAAAIGDDAMFKTMLNEQGTFYFNKNGDITVNSPAAVKAVQTEKEMVDKGIVQQVAVATGWNDTIKAFVNNQIASVPFGVWYAGTIETSAPDQSGKWGVFPLPSFTPGGVHAANLGGSNLMISAKTKDPQVAYDFAKFCMTNTQALDNSMNVGIFPSYIPYYSSPIFDKGLSYFGGQNVFKMAADEAQKIPEEYYTSDFMTAHNYVQNALGAAISGKQPIQQALDDAANKIAKDTGRKIAQ